MHYTCVSWELVFGYQTNMHSGLQAHVWQVGLWVKSPDDCSHGCWGYSTGRYCQQKCSEVC